MKIKLKNNFRFFRKVSNYIKKIFYSIFEEPKYLIRLDDSCETQDQKKWDRIEKILDKLKIKPIVGIIPNNCDNSLKFSPSNKDFWELVKTWQDKRWTIAMHGYQHLFHETEKKGLVFPFYSKSEFGGLNIKVQIEMIKRGYKIMTSHNIKPSVWIAPAHTFDKETIIAIKKTTDIKVISDGISIVPYMKENMIFIPQQLWEPKKRIIGIWTICLHPNNISESGFKYLEKVLSSDYFIDKFSDLDNLPTKAKGKGFLSYVYSAYFWIKWNTRIYLKRN